MGIAMYIPAMVMFLGTFCVGTTKFLDVRALELVTDDLPPPVSSATG
jgi:hypothetical protein